MTTYYGGAPYGHNVVGAPVSYYGGQNIVEQTTVVGSPYTTYSSGVVGAVPTTTLIGGGYTSGGLVSGGYTTGGTVLGGGLVSGGHGYTSTTGGYYGGGLVSGGYTTGGLVSGGTIISGGLAASEIIKG